MSNPQREPAYIKIVITKDVYEKMAEFKANWGGVPVTEVVVRVETPEKASEVLVTMSEFLEALGLGEADRAIRPCETCAGKGEVRTMGAVYAGEPHQADVDTEKCPDCSMAKGHGTDEE